MLFSASHTKYSQTNLFPTIKQILPSLLFPTQTFLTYFFLLFVTANPTQVFPSLFIKLKKKHLGRAPYYYYNTLYISVLEPSQCDWVLYSGTQALAFQLSP